MGVVVVKAVRCALGNTVDGPICDELVGTGVAGVGRGAENDGGKSSGIKQLKGGGRTVVRRRIRRRFLQYLLGGRFMCYRMGGDDE